MMRRSWLLVNLLQSFLVRDHNRKLTINFQPNSYATRFHKFCMKPYLMYLVSMSCNPINEEKGGEITVFIFFKDTTEEFFRARYTNYAPDQPDNKRGNPKDERGEDCVRIVSQI